MTNETDPPDVNPTNPPVMTSEELEAQQQALEAMILALILGKAQNVYVIGLAVILPIGFLFNALALATMMRKRLRAFSTCRYKLHSCSRCCMSCRRGTACSCPVRPASSTAHSTS